MKIIVEKKAVTVFSSHGEPKKFTYVKGAIFMQKIAQDAGFVDWESLVDHVSQYNELPSTTTPEELYSQESIY